MEQPKYKQCRIDNTDMMLLIPETQNGIQSIPFSAEMWFGLITRGYRINAGLDLRQLEVKTGINYPYLSNIEKGKISPTLALVGKLEKCFGNNFSIHVKIMSGVFR